MKSVLLIVVIGFGLLWLTRTTAELRRNETAVHRVEDSRAELAKKVSLAEHRLKRVTGQRAAMNQVGPLPSPPQPSVETSSPVRPSHPLAVIANDPQKLAEFARNYRVSLEKSHGGVFKALGLAPNQIEALKDLLTEVEQRRLELVAAAENAGQSQDSDTYKGLNAENQKYRMNKEAEILGELEPPYREYYRTQIVRDYAQRLAVAGLYSGVPITRDQVERTATILAANSERIDSGNRRGWVKDHSVDWTVANEQLRAVLSPPQIATLRTFVETDERMTKANQRIAERKKAVTAQFAAEPPPK